MDKNIAFRTKAGTNSEVKRGSMKKIMAILVDAKLIVKAFSERYCKRSNPSMG
jgi:hypothetical protein